MNHVWNGLQSLGIAVVLAGLWFVQPLLMVGVIVLGLGIVLESRLSPAEPIDEDDVEP